MKTITILFIFISSFSFGQSLEDLLSDGTGETKIDTVSQHYIDAKNAGVEFFAFSTSGCDKNFENERLTELIKFEEINDTLTILIGFSEACCVSFSGDIEYTDNNLNLIYDIYGEPCKCICNYTLTYKIKTTQEFENLSFNGMKLEIE